MDIVLSQLKEYEEGKVKAVIDICTDTCTIENCPNRHIAAQEVKKGIISKILSFFGKKDCEPQKKLNETFPFVGTDTIRERIFALGIMPGAKVKMMGQSPLKDPMLVDLSGHLVSIRKAEADLIMVEKED